MYVLINQKNKTKTFAETIPLKKIV